MDGIIERYAISKDELKAMRSNLSISDTEDWTICSTEHKELDKDLFNHGMNCRELVIGAGHGIGTVTDINVRWIDPADIYLTPDELAIVATPEAFGLIKEAFPESKWLHEMIDIQESPFEQLEVGIINNFRFIESPQYLAPPPVQPEDWRGQGKRKMRRQR